MFFFLNRSEFCQNLIGQVWTYYVGTSQVGTVQVGTGQVGTDQVRTGQVKSGLGKLKQLQKYWGTQTINGRKILTKYLL